MSVNEDVHNTNMVRERTIETALNLLDSVQKIRTLTPVYKSQFVVDVKNQIDTLLDYLHIGYSVGAISRMNVDILAKELHALVDTMTAAMHISLMQNEAAHIEIPDSFFNDIASEVDEIMPSRNLNTTPEKISQKPEPKEIIKDNYKGHILNNKTIEKPKVVVGQNKLKTYVSNNDKRQNRKDLILNFITQKRLEGQNDGVMIKDILIKIKPV